ncbi:MAG TPA: hypothetical protein VJQ82_27410 [Terriglobales bacterium]|nr:hypothetical protein [Terriglobales bacterium]
MKQWLETRRVLVSVLALGFFAMAARPVTDPDVWWHLRTGELIASTHAFVRVDPYSFTRHGRPWVNHEWLSDLLVYGLYRLAGWGGLIAAAAAITSLALMLVFVRSPGRPYFAALALLWGAYAAAPTWGVRPHTISLLLASVFLLLLDRSEQNPRLLWLTVPLTLLWVNLHAEFALGIVLIALFLAGEALEITSGQRRWESSSRKRLQSLGFALIACLAVVPLNPNGSMMYRYPVSTLLSPAMQRYIAEWSSPNFHDAKYLPFALMLCGILFLLANLSYTPRLRDLLLLLVTAGGALQSVRHISVFILVAVPVISALMQAWWSEHGHRFARTIPTTRRTLVFNAVVLASVVSFAAIRMHSVAVRQPQTESESFPMGAVQFLLSARPPGPILNHYNFGGYLIWRLQGQYPVYIDGRADLYGDDFLHQFARTYYVASDWQKPFEQWKIRTAVLPADAPVLSALTLSGRWKEAYHDSQAVVVTRTLP